MRSIKIMGLAAVVALSLTAFAGVATASSPSFFTSSSYPASLNGEATGAEGQLSTVLGMNYCQSPDLTGTVNKPSETLTTSVDYSCGILSAGGCEFTFHPPAEGVNGTFDIGGSECKGMTGEQLGGVKFVVLPQTGLAATFENEGSGAGAKVKIQANVTGLKYEVTNSPKYNGTYSNGTYTTGWNLTSPSGVQISPYPGFSVIGEGASRMFHADLYPVTIGGGQVEGVVNGKTYAKNELSTVAGTFKCNTATLVTTPSLYPDGLGEDAEYLALTPTYGGCTIAGIGATVTPESGCFYDFNLSGVWPGYMGLCGLEIKPTGTTCTVKVTPQMRSGLQFFNIGSGSSAEVEVKADLGSIQYEVSNGAGTKCPGKPANGTYSTGTFKGVMALKVADVV